MKVVVLLCAFCSVFLPVSIASDIRRYPLLMPNIHPSRPELYLCTPIKILPDKTYYIVGFEPNATMDTIHHMLIYGCSKPGNMEHTVWNCGEMSSSDSYEKTYSPCAEGSQVIYAWARNAPMLTLPKDVGFQVGKGSQIKYIVLQVHYGNIDKFKDGSKDNSGLSLHYTDIPKPYLAGVILLGTGGVIPPNSITKMEADCKITEEKTIYPFAYRSHTHSLGKVVSGYRVRPNENNIDEWTLLGKRNPLTPQMFYPVLNTEPITYGDRLAARCTMESHRTSPTHIGPTNKDEMCNLYLLYYVKKGKPLDMKYCFTQGPPYFSWKNSENHLNHIPDEEASTL